MVQQLTMRAAARQLRRGEKERAPWEAHIKRQPYQP